MSHAESSLPRKAKETRPHAQDTPIRLGRPRETSGDRRGARVGPVHRTSMHQLQPDAEQVMTTSLCTSTPASEGLSEHELAAEGALALPARQAMSTVRLSPGSHIAMPINEALALNYESTDSVAFADAE